MGQIANPTSTSYLTLWGSSIYHERGRSPVSKQGHVTWHVTKLITESQTKQQSEPGEDDVHTCEVVLMQEKPE
jgi:hypothetical protein